MSNLNHISAEAWIGIGVLVFATAVLIFAAAMFRWQARVERKRTERIQSRVHQAVIDELEHDLYVHSLRTGGVNEAARAMGEALSEALTGEPVEKVDLTGAIQKFGDG